MNKGKYCCSIDVKKHFTIHRSCSGGRKSGFEVKSGKFLNNYVHNQDHFLFDDDVKYNVCHSLNILFRNGSIKKSSNATSSSSSFMTSSTSTSSSSTTSSPTASSSSSSCSSSSSTTSTLSSSSCCSLPNSISNMTNSITTSSSSTDSANNNKNQKRQWDDKRVQLCGGRYYDIPKTYIAVTLKQWDELNRQIKELESKHEKETNTVDSLNKILNKNNKVISTLQNKQSHLVDEVNNLRKKIDDLQKTQNTATEVGHKLINGITKTKRFDNESLLTKKLTSIAWALVPKLSAQGIVSLFPRSSSNIV